MSLFSEVAVGSWRLPNRVVMAPMTRSRAGHGKCPGRDTATYYAQRASAGLIISEATHVCQDTSHSERSAGIYTESQVEAWAGVARAVHAAGGRIVLQLWHLGRAWHGNSAHAPVGPSAIAARVLRPDTLGVQRPLPVPRELDLAGIQAVVAQFRQAALNAVAAGIDGVEVHGANGFLIDQFLRDGSNRRSDGYGGTPARRARLLVEITEAVCEAIGADRVGVRLSPRKTFNDMHDSTPFDTFGTSVAALNRFDVAYLHLASEAPGSCTLADGTNCITQALRERFDGPLIVNGGYDRLRAASEITSGAADLVSFATAFIANPDLVRRMHEGAPLSAPDSETIYKGGARGYIDYPALDDLPQALPPDH